MLQTQNQTTIISRSISRAPSCLKQLTVWVEDREGIEFAIEQLDLYDAPWVIKKKQTSYGDFYAVFIPGENDSDEV